MGYLNNRLDGVLSQDSIVALLIACGAKIDVLWQIFIGVHFGIGALLLMHRTGFTTAGRCLALGAYSLFLFINFFALRSTYRVFSALHDQLRLMTTVDGSLAPTLQKSLLAANFENSDKFLQLTHGSALIAVIFVIFYAEKLLRPEAATKVQLEAEKQQS